MKVGTFAGAAIALTFLSGMCGTAQAAPEWNVILLEKVVDRTPDQTWAKIGPYCAIATWLKVTCQITSGNQLSVGTNRRLNGKTDEIIVAQTPYSYTYGQQPSDIQPGSPIYYHGTLAVEPLDRGARPRSSTPCCMIRRRWARRRPRSKTAKRAPSASAKPSTI